VIKAQGAASLFSGVKDIHGNNYPGISGNLTEDLYTPNQPMGKGQGIIPGQVSWVWNSAATNPSCANMPVSAELSEDKYDAWFMDRNTSQEIVDSMLADGLCSISGQTKTGDPKNWPAGIVYAKNGNNIPMNGLGVHEHWNNPMDKQYSRNLGKGEGIELVKIFQSA
jgi:hypothetical protein